MTSRLTSTIVRRTSSFRHSSLGGLSDTIRGIGSNNSYSSNEYIHKNFFDEDNYLSIIKCFDGGYDVENDLLEYMQDRLDILKDIVKKLTAYSTKWKAKIKDQSSYSSYNTTKRAQLQVTQSAERNAQLIQLSCDEIQKVITAFKKQIDQTYPSGSFSTTRKHHRSESMKTSFKNARTPLIKLNEKLEKLYEKERSAQNSLNDANKQVQNLELDETLSKSKVTKARDNRENKQRALEDIQDKIVRVEQESRAEQENYRQRATDIYQQCRELQEARLNQIREVLIKFTQAMHPGQYTTEQEKIYNDLLVHIKSEQDTAADLDFWARTYHVDIRTECSSIENDETTTSQTTTIGSNSNNLTTIDENSEQTTVNESEEKAAISTKPKARKKKSNTTEPTTPETTA